MLRSRPPLMATDILATHWRCDRECDMTYDERMNLLARIGFAAWGLVYILIEWFALDVAVNGGQLKDN